ncbi:Cytosolic carboxypeptidase 1, partial [Irineochytrium annulatum]
HHPERELRRRIVRQCLELKRCVDKDGQAWNPDSPLHRIFYSKAAGGCGVAVLLKCLRVLPDIDVAVIVTGLLLRVSNPADSHQANYAFLARRSASVALFRCLSGVITHYAGLVSSAAQVVASTTGDCAAASLSIHSGAAEEAAAREVKAYAGSMATSTGRGVANISTGAGGGEGSRVAAGGAGKDQQQAITGLGLARLDELLVNLFTLICKVSKFDPKMQVIARLNGGVDIVVSVVKKWQERKDPTSLHLGLQTLKALALKTDNNLQIMHKRGVLDILASALRGASTLNMKEVSSIETSLDLLSLLAKNEVILREILKMFGTSYFVSIFTSTNSPESIQKCTLKLIRAIVDSDEGRRAFAQTDGIDVLTASLESITLLSEVNNMSINNTINTIPSLLISALRAAVSETDLPHLQRIKHRPSPFDVYNRLGGLTYASSAESLKPRKRYRRTPNNGTLPNATLPNTTDDASYAPTPFTPETSPPTPSTFSYADPPLSSHLLHLLPSALYDDDAELAHLKSLCPESLPPPHTTSSPISASPQTVRAVLPLDPAVPNVQLNLNRIIEPLKPSPAAAISLSSNHLPTPPPVAATPSNGSRTPSSTHGSSSSQPSSPSSGTSGGMSGTTVTAAAVALGRAGRVTGEKPGGSGYGAAPEPEALQRRSNNAMRRMVLEQTTRILKPGLFTDIVAYDVMDESAWPQAVENDPKILQFESRFESGNLQMAIKASDTEYDLMLQTDIGSFPGKHNQVSISDIFTKESDLLNHYRKPIVPKRGPSPPSRPAPTTANSTRSSTNNPATTAACPSSLSTSTYSTLSFTLSTTAANDVLYVAYHYPYTATDLHRFLSALQKRDGKGSARFDERCRRQTLCLTEGGNEVELLTITAFDKASVEAVPLSERVYIFLTSRVHPGESNSSFIIQGVIRFLLGDDEAAAALRRSCIFKIVPMLNPDGVINGSHRCGLAGTDLNREWKSPDKTRSPSIYWTKLLWKHLVDSGHRPLVACDFHGHSRRKNVFIFGCENGPGHSEGLEKIFPSLLSSISPLFDMSACKYTIERSKEATARVVLWREMGIVGSYTLESTYCGADMGEKKGYHIQIADLERVGADFCCALWGAMNVFNGRVPVATVKGGLSSGVNGGGQRDKERESSSSGEEK